jgi:acyl dehydratase
MSFYAKAAAAMVPGASKLPWVPGSGDTLPDVELERGLRVDRDHLARYARVCGFGLGSTLPAPFVHVLTFGLQLTLMAEPDFPLPLPGVVHVANRLELRRPIGVGESLDLTVHAEGLRPHPKGRQVDLVGEARVDGELVWLGRSTYLAKGAAPGDAGADEQSPLDVDLDPAAPPQARWRLPSDLGRRYAAVSGDVNPIHLSPLAARAFGFPRTIAHGMWSMARCMAALRSWAPEVAVTQVEFRRPVLLPGTVELRTRRDDGRWQFTLASRAGEHLRGVTTPLDAA